MFLITVFTFHIWFSQLNTSITQSLQHSVVNNNKSESDDFTGTRLLLLIPRCSTLHFTVSNQPLETLNIFATQNVVIFFIKCGWFVYFQLVGDQHHWCVVITGHTLGSYWHHTLASHPAPSRHQQPRSALRPRQLLPMTSMLQRIISAQLQHVLLCFILIELTQEKKILFSLIIINKADCATISSVDVYNDLRESQMQWSSQSPLLIQTQPYLARGCHLLTLVQQYKQDVMYGLSVRGGRGRRGCWYWTDVWCSSIECCRLQNIYYLHHKCHHLRQFSPRHQFMYW